MASRRSDFRRSEAEDPTTKRACSQAMAVHAIYLIEEFPQPSRRCSSCGPNLIILFDLRGMEENSA